MTVVDNHPHLTTEQRLANARAGLCHCGCPLASISSDGWRRCVWSYDIEFRIDETNKYGLEYRHDANPRATLRQWNDAKEASGLVNDREVHALLLFLMPAAAFAAPIPMPPAPTREPVPPYWFRVALFTVNGAAGGYALATGNWLPLILMAAYSLGGATQAVIHDLHAQKHRNTEGDDT